MSASLTVAFGPEAPEFGSWNWIGGDLSRRLGGWMKTMTFRKSAPDCDVVVFVKFKPPAGELQRLRQRSRIIYAPVDVYGSAAEIDADVPSLELCDLVVVHCERLRKYFSSYARTEYGDHHLKFVGENPAERKLDGPFVWVGNRANLSPVVHWLNGKKLPGEVWLLTDLPSPRWGTEQLGLTPRNQIRLEMWSGARHCEWASLARAAFDVKADDFRARHKPPAKALDWIASGVPLAMNRDSSSSAHLSTLGFAVCPLEDQESWLSESYWQSTQSLARQLRASLSIDHISRRWHDLILEAFACR